MPAMATRLLPLILIAAAIVVTAGGSSPVGAGTGAPVMYVDGAAVCGGNTPCFTTIDDAIEALTPVDTEIRVYPGTYNETVDFDDAADDTGGLYGDLAIISVDSKNVATPGAIVDGGPDPAFFNEDEFNADLRIDGFTVRSETDGIFVVGSGMVTIQRVDAGGAAGDGINVDAAGDILLDAAFANRSVAAKESPDGFDLQGEGNITVINSQTSGHNGPGDSNGLEIEASSGEVFISNTIANFNSGAGIAIESVGAVTVAAAGVEGNAQGGLLVEGYGPVLVEFFGARTNVGNGIEITTLEDVTVQDSFAQNNAGSGIVVASDGDVAIERVSVVDNNLPPIRVGSQGNPGAIEVRSHPHNLNSPVDTLRIVGSVVQTNGGDGILLIGTQDGTPVTITSNAICQNTGAGLSNLWNTTATATNNWWGDTTGPTATGNPGGGGDEITNIDDTFDPWISTVEGEVVSPPALTNIPAPIAFEFSNGDGAAELEQGLGWPAEIEVSTDNGVLDSEVPGQDPGPVVAAEIIDGSLQVELTAASAGNADIDLTAPCGLGGEIQVPVQAGTLFGDVDCNGSVDTVDALKINRDVAGLDVTQTEPCTDIGNEARLATAGLTSVFGDLDCDGAITPVDALAVLRHVASLPPLQVPQGCPAIGN